MKKSQIYNKSFIYVSALILTFSIYSPFALAQLQLSTYTSKSGEATPTYDFGVGDTLAFNYRIINQGSTDINAKYNVNITFPDGRKYGLTNLIVCSLNNQYAQPCCIKNEEGQYIPTPNCRYTNNIVIPPNYPPNPAEWAGPLFNYTFRSDDRLPIGEYKINTTLVEPDNENVIIKEHVVRFRKKGEENQVLKSNFLKNDLIAQSILSRNPYRLSDNNFIQNGKYDTTSFEFKIMNVFKILGYRNLITQLPGEKVFTASLHRFQENHGIQTFDILDKNLLLLIDSELSQKEIQDNALANQYEPLSKFIDAPLNEPPKEHLAALYVSFFRALPEGGPAPFYPIPFSVDEFRRFLIKSGNGGNLGLMMDPSGSRVLEVIPPDEADEIIRTKRDFKFCPSRYYDGFNTFYEGNCVNPPRFVYLINGGDFYYLTVLAHEFCHGLGWKKITINEKNENAYYPFGRISFGGEFVLDPATGLPLSTTVETYWLRPKEENYGEFVSDYARGGYGPGENRISPGNLRFYEDFAESCALYLLDGKVFREKIKSNQYLRQKYNFIKQYIFNGKEFDTGNLNAYNLWLSHSVNSVGASRWIPFSALDYYSEDPNWVWDNQYKIKTS